MKKILYVALNDLRITFADRSTLVFLVVIPAVLVIVVGMANGAFANTGGSTSRTVMLINDQDQSEISQQLVANIDTISPDFILCPQESDNDFCKIEADVTDAEAVSSLITGNKISSYIEIPAGFGASFDQGQPASVVYRSDEQIQDASPGYNTLDAAVRRLNGALTARQVSTSLTQAGVVNVDNFSSIVFGNASAIWANNPVTVNRVELELDEATLARRAPGFRQSVPGMGSMYVMFTVLAGVTLLLIERKNWTLQRMMTMPVTKGQFIAGKMLGRIIMGMIQYGVAFGVGIVLAQWQGFSLGNPLGLVAVMLAFTLCISALALLLGTMVKNDMQAAGVTTLIALTLAPIGGAWWSLDMEFIPQFMKSLSYVSPIRYAMDGFNTIIIDGGTVIDVLPQVGVLVGIALVLYIIAIRRFRYD